MRIRLSDYISTARGLLDGSRVEIEIEAARRREVDLSPYLDFGRRLRVLDLANGNLTPQYALLRAAGHEVYGIDLINIPTCSWQGRIYRLARWFYARHVPGNKGFGATSCLVGGDVCSLPFQSGCFDLITSMSAFEHFLDVPAVVSEMVRILRPGGCAWVRIHPFTSLSGEHNLSLTEIPLRHLPPGVAAWDHLRDRRLPFTVPLNEWRIARYLEVFSARFEILNHYCAVEEGEEFLAPDIEKELPGYTPDELTWCTYAIVARKMV